MNPIPTRINNHFFQTHSRRVALEWIERLRALIVYWRQRHRVDARTEMDLAQSFRPPLTPHTRACQDDDMPPQSLADPAAPLPDLNRLYDWCVMKGCKPIVKGGKLFVRRGFHGPYKSVPIIKFPPHTDFGYQIGPNVPRVGTPSLIRYQSASCIALSSTEEYQPPRRIRLLWLFRGSSTS
jgi:hypothetical protein